MFNIFKKSKEQEILSVSATLKTGEVINTDNEQGFVQGAEVYIISPEGDKVTLLDGEYIMNDESSLVIKDGVIDSMSSNEETPTEEEPVAEEDMADAPVEDAPVQEETPNDPIKSLEERISKLEELVSKLEEVKAENESLKNEVVELSKQPAVQSIHVEDRIQKSYDEMSAFEKYQYNKKVFGF
jgi:hypothetical protein